MARKTPEMLVRDLCEAAVMYEASQLGEVSGLIEDALAAEREAETRLKKAKDAILRELAIGRDAVNVVTFWRKTGR